MIIFISEPATQYEMSVSGFTAKREGSPSDPRRVRTDTAKPSPPTITNVNCTGRHSLTQGDIQRRKQSKLANY